MEFWDSLTKFEVFIVLYLGFTWWYFSIIGKAMERIEDLLTRISDINIQQRNQLKELYDQRESTIRKDQYGNPILKGGWNDHK